MINRAFKLKDYDGPLDLLLTLIGKAQIDIRDIFVSEITDQYLEIVRNAPDLDMDEASDFLLMAATLLEIKSRAMLPRPPKTEDETDPDVIDSLRSIESSLRKIGRLAERRPELEEKESVKQLRELYLPKTMELIKKLWVSDPGPEAMLEIKGILNTCATAYGSIVDKLYKSEDEDTLIDMEVLQQIFAREGLLGSDVDIE